MTAQEMVRRSVADDSYGRAPLARSVELREVHALPGAEHELTFVHRKRHVVTDEDRFDVRGGISFRMTVVTVLRNDLRELKQQITLHIRVGVLIHEYRCGCMRNVYHTYTFADLRPRDRGPHARGPGPRGRAVREGAQGSYDGLLAPGDVRRLVQSLVAWSR